MQFWEVLARFQSCPSMGIAGIYHASKVNNRYLKTTSHVYEVRYSRVAVARLILICMYLPQSSM